MSLEIKSFYGGDARPFLDDVARLRIAVFRDFPYLYDKRFCTFCAVERPADHPRRPAGYVPLNDFWTKRGYRHHPELRTTFTWRDLDEDAESPKPLSFWLREIGG